MAHRTEIAGKVTLVTGANRGIGKAILETFIARGAAKVYAGVRNTEKAAPLVSAYGDQVVPVEIDLGRPDTITAAAKNTPDVQIVVNNAGILRNADPLSPDAVEFLSQEMNINVYGLIRMAQAFAPILKNNGGGAFVQLNSVASLRAFPAFATYAASKAASYSITQSLHSILGEDGIHVLSVHPGPIASDMADAAGLADVAEPPTLVSDGIVDALAAGDYHLFPDTLARQMWQGYAEFAANVVEPGRD